jgi:RNA polymerase sigma-70 factor (ECF subfamily)
MKQKPHLSGLIKRMDAISEMTPEREAQWVRRAQGGDTQAFEHLVVAHQRYAYNLAVRGLGDPHAAEDVTQEAFLRAWRALPKFRGGARFATWLYRIIINLCYSRLPALRREMEVLEVQEVLDDLLPDSDQNPYALTQPALDPQEVALMNERRKFIFRQIEALPESYRLIALLRFRFECSYEEIAGILDIPVGTVKTGIYRARRQLREALGEYEEALV